MTTISEAQALELITQAAAEDEADANRPAPVMVDAALWYATKLRWPVFPLTAGDKIPFKGTRGFKDATCDLAYIRRLWDANPDANIGTPTGPQVAGGCGYDVIDVDGIEGNHSLATMRHALCPPDCCATDICQATGIVPHVWAKSATGRPDGGRHLFITPTGDTLGSGWMPGIDYRGAGGYVVLPPSINTVDYPAGQSKQYRWLELSVPRLSS